MIRNIKRAVRAGKLLWSIRGAFPRWVRVLVTITAVVKAVTAPLPVDGGLDELLLVITGAVLWFRHRTLVRACWHEAGAAQ